METVNINLKNISIKANGTRAKASEEELSLLADSIALNGLLQPITVAADPKKKNSYFVVMGRRRTQAAKIAGLKEIPCVIVDGDADKLLSMEIQENLNRENLSVIDEAIIANAAMTLHGNVGNVAIALSRPTSWVVNRLSIARLPEEIKQAYLGKHLSLRTLMDMTGWSEKRIEQTVQLIIDNPGKSIKAKTDMFTLVSAPFDTTDETLVPEAGACTGCPFNTSVNSLFNEYSGMCTKSICYDQKVKASHDAKLTNWLINGGLIISLKNYESQRLSDELMQQVPDQILDVPGIYNVSGVAMEDDDYSDWQLERGEVNRTAQEKRDLAMKENPGYVEVMKANGQTVLVLPETLVKYRQSIDDANNPSRNGSVSKSADAEDSTLNRAQRELMAEIVKKQENCAKYESNAAPRLRDFMQQAIKDWVLEADVTVVLKKFKDKSPLFTLLLASLAKEAGYNPTLKSVDERIVFGLRQFLIEGSNSIIFGDINEAKAFVMTVIPEVLQNHIEEEEAKLVKRKANLEENIAKLTRQIQALEGQHDPEPSEEVNSQKSNDEDEDDDFSDEDSEEDNSEDDNA